MKKVFTFTKYVVNGRTYRSLDEMPEADRRMFKDANKNGIPDAVENMMQVHDRTGEVQTSTFERNEVITHTGAPTDIVHLLESHAADPVPQSNRRSRFTIQLTPATLVLLIGAAIAIGWILAQFAAK